MSRWRRDPVGSPRPAGPEGHERLALLVSDSFGRRYNLSEPAVRRIEELATVVHLKSEDDGFAGEFHRLLPDTDALLLAGWETPVPFLAGPSLATAGNLRFIGCHQDNRWRFVDTNAALGRGLALVDGSGAMAGSVAEFTLGLILTSLRNITAHHGTVAAGGWYDGWDDAEGVLFTGELRGRTVGVVGMGAIGSRLLQLLQPFRCRLLLSSRHLAPDEARRVGAELVQLDELLEACDVLVVTSQVTRATAGMIDRRRIGLVRRGSVVVAVSRAALFDMAALEARVVKGELKLAIDVFPEEPPPVHYALRGLPNVVHTPHIAGRTLAANRAVFIAVVDDLERHCTGRSLRWEADPGRLLQSD